MKVIASAAGDRAWEPPGNKTTGTCHLSSSPSGDWLAAKARNSRPSCIATQVAWTISSGVSVEPPTKIIEVPASTATHARSEATCGDCLSGSISVTCLTRPLVSVT